VLGLELKARIFDDRDIFFASARVFLCRPSAFCGEVKLEGLWAFDFLEALQKRYQMSC